MTTIAVILPTTTIATTTTKITTTASSPQTGFTARIQKTTATTPSASSTHALITMLNSCHLHPLAVQAEGSGSTCPHIMEEGQRCTVSCVRGFTRVGFFTCSKGVRVGDSVCLPQDRREGVALVMKIAATLRVTIDFGFSVALEEMEKFLQMSIADSLNVSIEHVVKHVVLEIGQDQGVRRLAPAQRTQYKVAYEILPPSFVDVEVLVRKANLIARPSTMESQVFQQTLKGQPGIEEVHMVLEEVAARKFEDEVVGNASLKEDRAATSSATWAHSPPLVTSRTWAAPVSVAIVVMASLVGCVLVGVCLQIQLRKLTSAPIASESDVEAQCTSVLPRAPSSNGTLFGTLGQHKTVPIAWESTLEVPTISVVVAACRPKAYAT